MPLSRRTARRLATMAVIPLSLMASGALVWQASHSAFVATTSSGSNSWTSGTVNLTSDQNGVVVFPGLTALKPDANLNSLAPGNTGGAFTASHASSGGSACIKVTYSGTLSSNIRLHATVGGADAATLGGQILFTVDMVDGTAGQAANLSCSAYPTGSSYIYGTSGTTTSFLKDLPDDFADASATQWTNVSNGGVKWYRLSWLLPKTVHETSTTARNVTATFTWEAQNV